MHAQILFTNLDLFISHFLSFGGWANQAAVGDDDLNVLETLPPCPNAYVTELSVALSPILVGAPWAIPWFPGTFLPSHPFLPTPPPTTEHVISPWLY